MGDAIETPRLRLVPFTYELAEAAMGDRARLAARLGVAVPAEWPAPEFGGILALLAQAAREDATRSGLTRLVVHRQERALIGDVGFKAPPDAAGVVEIGYSINERYRRRGLASEAAAALIDWGRRRRGVRRVLAECLDDNVASRRVLERLGMVPAGRDGRMLRWELPCPR
jgi:ribosomal-protein-alanine N-acetyltransferase